MSCNFFINWSEGVGFGGFFFWVSQGDVYGWSSMKEPKPARDYSYILYLVHLSIACMGFQGKKRDDE